jgi:hypothetical protein
MRAAGIRYEPNDSFYPGITAAVLAATLSLAAISAATAALTGTALASATAGSAQCRKTSPTPRAAPRPSTTRSTRAVGSPASRSDRCRAGKRDATDLPKNLFPVIEQVKHRK